MVTIEAKAGKWLMLALLISVGANMFMGGLLAGRYAHPGPEPLPLAGPGAPPAGPGQGEAPIGNAIRRIAASLPDDQRTVFEQAFVNRRRDIAQATFALREARLRLRDALTAEPFDRARVDQGFAELRRRNDELQHVLHDAATEGAAGLPIEARRRIANWNQLQPPRPPRPGAADRPPPRFGPGNPPGPPGAGNRP